MVSIKTLNQDLKKIGCHYPLWGRSEVIELAKVLCEGEEIAEVINGYYEGGFAQLCVTNRRVLLIDKKPLALTIEDLRYDMITEVDYGDRIITSNIHIITPIRTLHFSTWNRHHLRQAMTKIQDKVMEMRNQSFLSEQFHPVPMPAPSPRSRVRQSGRLAAALVRRVIEKPFRFETGIDHNDYDRGEGNQFEHQVSYVAIPRPSPLINPYHKAPLLARRRRYPSYYLGLTR